MKTEDIRALSTDEIAARLDDAKDEYFRLRFQIATGQQTDTAALGRTRRDVARLATILRERELAAELQGAINDE
jgi:large subunit ribosomal protein L29